MLHYSEPYDKENVDYLDEFYKAIEKYEPLIKAEAKVAKKKIKSFLVRTVNDFENKGESFVDEKKILCYYAQHSRTRMASRRFSLFQNLI